MKNDSFEKRIEAWFDNEPGRQSDHGIIGTPAAKAYLEALARMREASVASRGRTTLEDGQMNAFLHGIHERLAQPQRRTLRGFWAALSLSAAALIVALCTWIIFHAGNPEARATVVESYSTEIQDATVSLLPSPDGDATVWVNMPEGDLW